MGIIAMRGRGFFLLALALCAVAYADAAASEAAAGEGVGEMMGIMESLGLKQVQLGVDKKIWEAKQAKAEEDAEDEEVARLMASLAGLESEKNEAEAEAAKKDLEAKQATAAKLKAVAEQKAAQAEAALKEKARQVELAALAAQKEAEAAIMATKKLRASAAARMEKAKLASAEYQNALKSGQKKGLADLEGKAKKQLAEAQAQSKKAGEQSDAAKNALKNAATVKAKADKVVALEKESKQQLINSDITWAGGPIFDKMMRLCNIDYPTFRREYDKIRRSPVYKKYRWDIKKACRKSRDDTELENENAIAARAKAQEAKEKKAESNGEKNNIDPSKPYPEKNMHWKLPASKQVKKWCTTDMGAVPCALLKKAREAGLLGEPKKHTHHDAVLDDAPDADSVELLAMDLL